MDPQVTLQRILDGVELIAALAQASNPSEVESAEEALLANDGGDLSEIESATVALLRWLQSGNFPPEVTEEQLGALRTLADNYEREVRIDLFSESDNPTEDGPEWVAEQIRTLVGVLED